MHGQALVIGRAVLVVVAALIAAGLLGRIIPRRLQPSARALATRGLQVMVLFLAISFAVGSLGWQDVPLFSLAAVSLWMAAWFSSVAQDLLAGVWLLVEDRVRTGDYLDADGTHKGQVLEVGFMAIFLLEGDGTRHRVPNGLVFTTAVSFTRGAHVPPAA